MHYFELISAQFADEIADYLPKEAFNKEKYVLVFTGPTRRALLFTELDKLGELMDGLCINKQCRRIPKRVALTIKAEQRNATPEMVIGNLDLWERLT